MHLSSGINCYKHLEHIYYIPLKQVICSIAHELISPSKLSWMTEYDNCFINKRNHGNAVRTGVISAGEWPVKALPDYFFVLFRWWIYCVLSQSKCPPFQFSSTFSFLILGYKLQMLCIRKYLKQLPWSNESLESKRIRVRFDLLTLETLKEICFTVNICHQDLMPEVFRA